MQEHDGVGVTAAGTSLARRSSGRSRGSGPRKPSTSAMWLVDSASRAVPVIELLRYGPAPRHNMASAGTGRPNSLPPYIDSARSGIVDRVHPACVGVTPEPLDRRARLQRPPARILEQPVYGPDGLAGAADLVAPHPQPHVHRDLLACPRVAHQVGHVALERQPGAVDLGRRLRDAHLGERVLRRLLPDVGDPDTLAQCTSRAPRTRQSPSR